MLGQLAGLVNKPRHKDEDDKDSEEALVAWRGCGWGLAEPSPAVCRTALTHDAAPCPCPILPSWGVHAVAWRILTPLSFPEFSLFFIKPSIFKKFFKKYINLCLRAPLFALCRVCSGICHRRRCLPLQFSPWFISGWSGALFPPVALSLASQLLFLPSWC